MTSAAPPRTPDASEAAAELTTVAARAAALAAPPPTASGRLDHPGVPIGVASLGMGLWIAGLSALRASQIGIWGLLATANVWFVVGLGLLAVSFLLELRRPRPRGWLLGAQLIALIVAIHGTVPLLYHAPEYAWVYKHLGVAASLGQAGRVTQPNDIYQEWPVLFSAVAALSSLAHVSSASLAVWAPLAFELADALLLLAIFRLLARDRRLPWLAILLYEGLISWVGQDYLSPQAFGYLLWLAAAFIILRWLRAPVAAGGGLLARLRSPLLVWLDEPPRTTRAGRAVAVGLVCVIYLAIVAAHQLTPYIVLAEVGTLTVLGLVRPRWLVVALAVIAGGYLIPRYGLIESNFGGLFSGGNPIQNASGTQGTYHVGAEATTAQIVRALAAAMWGGSLWAIIRRRRTLGRVVIPGALAFTPFVVLGVQSYGGEAIYRVYMFSAPWCALLLAGMLGDLRFPRRLPLRWPLTAAVCLTVLFAGLQGLWGPAAVDGFTPAELTASHWMYSHLAPGSTVVFPDENFPAYEAADALNYQAEIMPADPQVGASWMNEGNVQEVEQWMSDLGSPTVYVVVSRSMGWSARYFGAPRGYPQLVRMIPTRLRGSAVYHDADTTIYQVNLG